MTEKTSNPMAGNQSGFYSEILWSALEKGLRNDLMPRMDQLQYGFGL